MFYYTKKKTHRKRKWVKLINLGHTVLFALSPGVSPGEIYLFVFVKAGFLAIVIGSYIPNSQRKKKFTLGSFVTKAF